MTQEEKQLLLKDLCARLPYGVKILHKGWNYEWDDELSTVERVVGIDEDFIYTKVIDTHNGEEYRDDKWPIDTFDDKLFLRPMSSMTEDESAELSYIISEWFDKELFYLTEEPFLEYALSRINYSISPLLFDWLNAHHFDYRGLIPMGLALEAPEGMYNIK